MNARLSCVFSKQPLAGRITSAIRPILSKTLQPAWLARTTLIPYLTLPPDALREITTLKMNKVTRRLADSHRMTLECDDAVLDQIADRCTEVETGARNIDHILEGTLLPMMSSMLLEKMAEGDLPRTMRLGVDDQGSFQLEFQDT